MSKVLILLYGVIAYFVGVIGLASIIVVLAGLMPWGFLKYQLPVSLNPIFWNVLLVTLWGVIHTVMARPSFKVWLTKFIAEPAERATYCLIAGITSVALVGLWATVPGQLWSIESAFGVYALWGLFIFAWVFLLGSTFAINHFDLFGLRQVYLNFKGQERPPLPFVKRAMYQYIRHPIQTGVLLGVWATPSMSMTQVILSIGFTLYIFIGLWFEERDLLAEHGDSYREYMTKTGKILPKLLH